MAVTFPEKFAEAVQTDGTLNAAAVAGSAVNGAVVDLDGYDGAVLEIKADFPVTPTDDLRVQIFRSIDGGTTWETVAEQTYDIDNTIDPGFLVARVEGPAAYRVTATRIGSTDTIAVTHRYRRYRTELTVV